MHDICKIILFRTVYCYWNNMNFLIVIDTLTVYKQMNNFNKMCSQSTQPVPTNHPFWPITQHTHLLTQIRNVIAYGKAHGGKWSTQLCMELATIKDQVGSLESKRLKGGIILAFFIWLSTLTDSFLLLCIYFNSHSVIWGLRSGVLDVADIHTKTHRNPDNPKIINGPPTPPCDMRIGERVSPIALPSWNPAIASPTALDRSVCGNHLKGTIQTDSRTF